MDEKPNLVDQLMSLSLVEKEFVKELTVCLKKRLRDMNTSQRNQVRSKLAYLLRDLADQKENIRTCMTQLVCFLNYHEFTISWDYRRAEWPCVMCDTQGITKCGIQTMGHLFCYLTGFTVVDQPLISLLTKIDKSFTSEIEHHLRAGVNLVPCVSLFRPYTIQNPENTHSHYMNSGEGWLMLVFSIVAAHNTDFKRRLYELYQSFRANIKCESDSECRKDFFCTILVPMLYEMNFINVERSEVTERFLWRLLHAIISVIGEEELLTSFCEYKKYRGRLLSDKIDIHKSDYPMYWLCYDLISLKPNTVNFLADQSPEKSPLPTLQLLEMVPTLLYKYEPVKSLTGQGFLTQLFHYAAGAGFTTTKKLIVPATDILSRLPFEWQNLKNIHDHNRTMINTGGTTPWSTFYSESDAAYFSVSAEDVYTSLYYISRWLLCYLEITEFRCQNYLFDMYDTVLEETTLKHIGSKTNRELVHLILKNMRRRIRQIFHKYGTAESKMDQFNFFSVVDESDNRVSCYKLSPVSTSLSRTFDLCNTYFFPENGNLVHLLLYLGTMAQVDRVLKMKPPKNIPRPNTDITFHDKMYYTHLMYEMTPSDRGHNLVHRILEADSLSPMFYIGLGILRLLSCLKNPNKPAILLMNLLTDFFHENSTSDMSPMDLVRAMYFTFKKNDMLQWFYPCLMGTVYAYAKDLSLFSHIKSSITDFCLGDNRFLLKRINKQEFETLSRKIDLSQKVETSETNTAREDGKMTIDLNVSLFRAFQKIAPSSLQLQTIRECDLFYFTFHLTRPLRFVHLPLPFTKTTSGYEIYVYRNIAEFNAEK